MVVPGDAVAFADEDRRLSPALPVLAVGEATLSAALTAHDSAPGMLGHGENEASSNGIPGSSPALPSAALRIEGTLAYRARVEAVYRQYDLDHGHSTAKEPVRETVTLRCAVRRAKIGIASRRAL